MTTLKGPAAPRGQSVAALRLLNWWILLCALASVAAVAYYAPMAQKNLAAWRALVVPLLWSGAAATVALRGLRGRDSWTDAIALLACQSAQVSAGPVAFRLLAGPYACITFAGHIGFTQGVLPKEYARPGLDKTRLGELVDLVSGIVAGAQRFYSTRRRDRRGQNSSP